MKLLWKCTASITQYSYAYGDYETIDLQEDWVRASSREEAEELVRDLWAGHGLNPGSIEVLPIRR